MKLAVFGATGPTGRQFVEQALARGHELRALVRPQSTAPPGVDAVVGDVLDADAVASTISGTEAVACILGLPKGEGTVISDGTAIIVKAMTAHQVNRDTAHGEIDRAIHFYEGSPPGQYDDLAVDGLRALQEKARLIELLAHAVKEADGWHDDTHGGPITEDPLIDEARALIKAAQQSDQPAPGSTDR